MGFKPSRKTFNIQYEQFPGLEILTYGMTNDEMLGFKMDTDPRSMIGKSKEEQMAQLTPFIGKVITWNLEHQDVMVDGVPKEDVECPNCGLMPGTLVPTTAEALLCFDSSFLIPLLHGWMRGVSGISDLKELNLTGGGKNGLGNLETQVMQELGLLQNPVS